MKKRKLHITLVSNRKKHEYNLLGEYDVENKIIFYEESKELLTKVTLDLKNHILIRDNKDYYLCYHFLEHQETENELTIKSLNQKIFLKIQTEKYFVSDQKIEIIYTILDSEEKIKYIVEF